MTLTRFVIASALAGTALTAQSNGASTSTRPSIDPVVQWNRNLLAIVRTPGAQPATIHPTRSFAMLHAAIYDAVNAIAGYPFEPYEVIPTVTMPASSEAAVATAGHSILVALFPAQQTELDTKDLSINNRNNFVVDHVKRVYATSEHRHGSAAALCGIERPAQ